MAMMDSKTLLKRHLLRPVDALTLLPFAAGATLGLGAWAFDARSGLWYFCSVALVLLSVLIYVQRLALGWRRDTGKILEAWQREQDQARERQLDELGLRLKKDKDPRTDALLDDLRIVTRDLAREVGQASGWVRPMSQETMDGVDRLFRACVQYLVKSLDLYATAASIKDKAIKRRNLDQREELIQEVQKSLLQLGEILVNVRAINLKHATNSPTGAAELEGLAQLRNELALKLQAAKEIEQAVNNPGERFPGVDMKKYIEKGKETKGKEGGG